MTTLLALPCSSVVTVNALLLDQSLAECRTTHMPQVAFCSMATRVLLGSTDLKVIWVRMLPVFFCVHNDWWLTEDSAKGTVDNRQYRTADSASWTVWKASAETGTVCIQSKLMLHVKQLAWRTGVFVCAGLRQNKSKQTNKKHPQNTVNENCSKKTRRVQFHDTDWRRNKNKTRTKFVIENRNWRRGWKRTKEKKRKSALWLLLCTIHADSAAQSTRPLRGYRFSDC